MSPAPPEPGDFRASGSALPGPPGKGFSIAFFSLAALVLVLLLGYVLADGPAFNDFPGRTIGISLLSDIDPHYRTFLFLLLSALTILASCAVFTFRGARPGWVAPLPLAGTTALLLACILANLLAAVLHADTPLFLFAAGHCTVLLALWVWHRRTAGNISAGEYVLRLGLGWQGATLLMWLAGLSPGPVFYGPFLVLYLLAGPLIARGRAGGEGLVRAASALSAWILCAPVLLVIAVEWAYFSRGAAVQPGNTLALFGLLSLPVIALAWLVRTGTRGRAGFAALCVLLSTFIVNQYDNEMLFRGYDLFHLAEKMLPLQQWDSYRSLPFLDYHPGHGLFDILPHGAYHLFGGGDPLESLLWGNGYFIGWFMQTLYIGLFYTCLSRFTGPVVAFFLLWLLPVFPVLDTYNTLLLLPVLHLTRLPASRRPLGWWTLQWLLTLALALWRADFGLIVAAGNIVTMVVFAWYRRDPAQLVAGAASLVLLILLMVLLVELHPAGDALPPLLARTGDLLSIQMLTASYDRFYKEWNYLAWVQYVAMPLLGAVAGGYSLARVYLREDHRHLATHLVVIFVTAIGFALSIRLFQRHSLVEGFTKTNFFYFAALLGLFTLRMRRGWRGPVAAVLVMAAFLATPKMMKYAEKSPWSPRRSYPFTTHTAVFPDLAKSGERLVDRVEKYDAFENFSSHYLKQGQTFYDFANAPLLYMLADVKLPLYVYETVWHTSEKVQDSTLAELEALRLEKRLPFVVFRRNNRWDVLDGVDNALRSYKMAEYIYRHFRPCAGLGKLDIWTDKRIPCRKSLQQRLPEDSLAASAIRPLPRNYLEQVIAFRHLPYIWANHDRHEDEVEQVLALTPILQGSGEIEFVDTGGGTCRDTGCYLDLVIESSVEQEVPVYFDDRKQLSFTVRPGSHRYRIRISALWRWHQQVDSERLALRPEHDFTVHEAELVQLARPQYAGK